MSENIDEEGDQQDLGDDSASSGALFGGSENPPPTKFSRLHTFAKHCTESHGNFRSSQYPLVFTPRSSNCQYWSRGNNVYAYCWWGWQTWHLQKESEVYLVAGRIRADHFPQAELSLLTQELLTFMDSKVMF